MNKQTKLVALIGLLILALSTLIIAENGTTNTVQEELGEKVCYNESDLNKLINQRNIILEERDYYKNLSKYYEELYLSKEINVGNRELINLYQDISILQQNTSNFQIDLKEIENEVSFLRLTFKLSFSLISITFIGLVLFKIKRVRKWIINFIN
jgi:hypothetical protein